MAEDRVPSRGDLIYLVCTDNFIFNRGLVAFKTISSFSFHTFCLTVYLPISVATTNTHNNCFYAPFTQTYVHTRIYTCTCTHTHTLYAYSLTHFKVQGAYPLWGRLFKVSVNGRIKVTMLFFSPFALPLNWILTTLSSWPGKVICCHYLRIMIKQKSSVTINMVFPRNYALFPCSHSTLVPTIPVTLCPLNFF